MFTKLLRLAAPGAAALLLVLGTTGDAQAQRRGFSIPLPGTSGPSGPANLNVGPSGINVGPSTNLVPGTTAPGALYGPNGYYPNGYYQNGVYYPNAYNQSGYYPNGYYPNGYNQNAYYPNGYTRGYPSANSTTAPSVAPAPQDRAVMNIVLPANARLWIGETQAASQTGSSRQFISPPLESGHAYQYDMKAQWTDNSGQTVERRRAVTIHPGDRVTVDFMQGS
jgi:uncharacterized protein (TIGR03000 family)